MAAVLANENVTGSTLLLSNDELVLANKKTNLNKVVFAAMLKFFEIELCFPTNNNRPSQVSLLTLYKQLIDLSPTDFILQNYDWENRSVERFRREIREYFGFRLFTSEDKKKLEVWLNKNAFDEGSKLKRSKRKAFDFFKQNRIQLITPGILDEYVRSSYIKFDKTFLNTVQSRLTADTKIKLKQLITQNDEEPEENTELIYLRDLKKDPPDILKLYSLK